MPRYFTQRRPAKSFYVEDDHYGNPPRDRDMFVPEHVATDTGLVNANGDSIMRAPNPVGFVW